ncbi:MAG: hypothetical protein RBT02_01610 [Bacteroidales bacterium]|jgi:hypothetical protein|nr:hypothetical protein [Bacteroidales bacterium]
MKKSLLTTAVIMAVFLLSTATGSAQDKKQIEKTITVISVNEDGITRDTTIIENDTLVFEAGNLIIDTRDGKRIIRKPGVGSRMVWNSMDEGFSGQMAAPGMRSGQMRAIHLDQEEMEGVRYHISVDGVEVTIRAPKEKVKEADQILAETSKILMKK